MNFGEAMQALKQGKQVHRNGWKEKGVMLFIVPGSKFPVNRPPLLGIFPEGKAVEYRDHLDIRNEDGTIGPYQPTHEDLLAEDWQVL
jgi:hypothetical protein